MRVTSILPGIVLAAGAGAQEYRYGVYEVTLEAAREYANPLKDVAIELEFEGPGKTRDTVRAFWDGGRTWRARYSPEVTGGFRWRARSTNRSDQLINGKSGAFKVAEYRGPNTLYRGGPPRLSFNRRYLVQSGGKPWFFLSDTAWNGALMSTAEEWSRYLAGRAANKFTAVQFVTTQWRAGRQDEKGQVAFTGTDPIRVNPAFWQRMDRKITAINQAGLVAVPVMLWALTSRDGESPGVSLPADEAIALARYVRSRYNAHHAIWLLGGDGDYAGANAARWKAIGRAVFPEGEKQQLAGMHPRGMRSPWAEYQNEPWLDILFYQSGHGDDARKWRWNATGGPAADWKMEPARPVIDAEPNYEAHISYQSRKKIDDYAVRRAAYYSLLAAPPAGVSYGAHGVWFWSRKAEVPLDHPRTGVAEPWWECLNYPGARQMKVMRDIFDSIAWWKLRPERGLLSDDKYDAAAFHDYVIPALSESNDFALIYLPANPGVKLNLTRFESGRIAGTWIDPRTGKRSPAGSWRPVAEVSLNAPGEGDWLLLLKK
ncbi:MAG: DUF4038 domain-containing protein [Acidobacteria bacterium]|nr:DUF4038 domain-containing protein [Acidobacteriota bacterium]